MKRDLFDQLPETVGLLGSKVTDSRLRLYRVKSAGDPKNLIHPLLASPSVQSSERFHCDPSLGDHESISAA